MSLLLQADQKQHLEYVVHQPSKALAGILKEISSGAIPTNIEDNDGKAQASRAIIKLLIDAKKLRLSEKDFNDQLKAVMDNERIEMLWTFLNSDTTISSLITSEEYKFRDLEWRLEAKIASRFSHSLPPEPKILLKFHLDKEKSVDHQLRLSADTQETSKKELLLQTDVNSLVHIIGQLETARTAINVKRAHLAPSQAS